MEAARQFEDFTSGRERFNEPPALTPDQVRDVVDYTAGIALSPPADVGVKYFEDKAREYLENKHFDKERGVQAESVLMLPRMAIWQEAQKHREQGGNGMTPDRKLAVAQARGAKFIYQNRDNLPPLDSVWRGIATSYGVLEGRGYDADIERTTRNGIGRLVTSIAAFESIGYETYSPKARTDEDVQAKIDLVSIEKGGGTIFCIQIKPSKTSEVVATTFDRGETLSPEKEQKSQETAVNLFIMNARNLQTRYPALRVVPMYLEMPAGEHRPEDIDPASGLLRDAKGNYPLTTSTLFC
ncbi:MAG: hypothetical protein AAB417_01990 [Patescibacteria group bacterium]